MKTKYLTLDIRGENYHSVEYADSTGFRSTHITPSKEAAQLFGASGEMLEALEKAKALLEMARQYLPKSIKNSDRFDLENGLANAIIPAIKKAKGE